MPMKVAVVTMMAEIVDADRDDHDGGRGDYERDGDTYGCIYGDGHDHETFV